MIKRFAAMQPWPIIPCSLCSLQPDLKRTLMETLLETMQGLYPGALQSGMNALQHAHPRFLLDSDLYDFDAGPASEAGDNDDAWS